MIQLPNNLLTSPLLKNASSSNPILNRQSVQSDLIPPEVNIPRVLQYYADYSGCGFWRMIWPEHLLNAFNHFTVHGSTVMNLDPRYYVHVKAVRIQRQATSHQLKFVQFLKKFLKKLVLELYMKSMILCFLKIFQSTININQLSLTQRLEKIVKK